MTKSKWWNAKKLETMSPDEWEQICDRCGKCCLHRLHNIESQEMFYTNVCCSNLDINNFTCLKYQLRLKIKKDCINITKSNIKELSPFLPKTCSYRLLNEGKILPIGHHLNSPKQNSKRQGNITKLKLISEEQVDLNDLENYIINDKLISDSH